MFLVSKTKYGLNAFYKKFFFVRGGGSPGPFAFLRQGIFWVHFGVKVGDLNKFNFLSEMER